MMGNKKSQQGIAAIGVMLIVVVLAVAATIAIPMFLQTHQVSRSNITRETILRIKRSIIGDPQILVERSRASFGFVGDLGVLPNTLLDLGLQGAYPLFAEQNNVWFGWRGPYLKSDIVNIGGTNYLTKTLDAWGTPIIYRTSLKPGVKRELASVCDPDNPDDDILEYIYDTEVSNYVHGSIFNSGNPATLNTAYSKLLNISYPDGDNTLETKQVQITAGIYDSINEGFLIPVGYRYFITEDSTYKKIASLNGYATLEESKGVVPSFYPPGESKVNFYGASIDAPFFERTFYNTDDTAPDTGSPIITLTGTWANDGNGNFWADEDGGEHRAVFGRADWADYRLEVNATLHQGRGYGIYYRSDGQALISGYCFQYDPGLTSGGRVAFVVRRVFSGSEQAPFQTRIMTLAEFPNVFNSSHQISITVDGARHIIKVDGIERFDFTDSAFSTGMPGLRSWDGNHYTTFHHLLVHEIPKIATGEFVWWSFEEGDGSTVYGSGFEVDAPEINGTLQNQNDIYRIWDNNNISGKAIYCEGRRNGYINFSDVLDLTPTSSFSISAWVKMPSFNSRREYVIISKIRNGQRRGWKLRASGDRNTPFRFNFYLVADNNEQLIVLNNAPVVTDTWYHVVVTYDGSGLSPGEVVPASRLLMYVTPQAPDNTLIATTTISADLQEDSDTVNGDPLRIGAGRRNNTRFLGYIDEVRVFLDKVLTPSEVRALFDKDK